MANLSFWANKFAAVIQRKAISLGFHTFPRKALPDFLGIGAQKAGSTWLHNNLSQHPELYLPQTKELHYFDREWDMPLSKYTSYYNNTNKPVKGEITPAYSILSEEKVRFIKKIMPDLKLILILRNPIERAWSSALMSLVEYPQRNFQEVHDHEFYSHFHSPSVRQRGDYHSILDRWLNFYPTEQMFIETFEEIPFQPRNLLERIFDYLGVTRNVDWSHFPLSVNPNKRPVDEFPKVYKDYLTEMYQEEISSLARRLSNPVILRWLEN